MHLTSEDQPMNTTDPSLSTIEDVPLFNGIDCQTELESRKMNPGFNSLLTIRYLGDMATEEDRQNNTLRSNTVVPARTQQPGPAPDQYLGELVNNRYLVEKELGRGGLGVVYLARDKHLLSKPVVLKVLLEESIKNEWARTKFSQEIEALARIDHPGIVGVLDAGEMPDGKPYLAMQFVEGKSLRSIIKEGGIGPERVKNLVQQMAKALTAVHEKGIYHRDLKPENIMLQTMDDGEEQIKIIDFGIARVENSELSVDTSASSMLVGTIAYMSPEQLKGEPVSAMSDIYTLGVITYELLTGKRPFAAQSAVQLYKLQRDSILTQPSQLVSDLPNTIDLVILKALAYDSKRRYQRARDFSDDLVQALELKTVVVQDPLDTIVLFGEHDTTLVPDAAPPTQKQILPEITDPGGGHLTRTGQLEDQNQRQRMIVGILSMLLLATLIWSFLPARINPVSTNQPPKVVTPTRSLAILPFRNLKPDPETDFLGFSLADAVITKLGYVQNLVVRPSSYVEKYRNQVIDPQQTARELNVDTLLTGSFLCDGKDLRITVQLVDVTSNTSLWQDTIDVKYERLLTVQDLVAQQLISELRLQLTPGESERLASEIPRDPKAYEYFLKGVNLYVTNDYSTAARMFEKSIEIDPNYALAWAHLGRALNGSASKLFGGREDYAKAIKAYEKALSINPHQIEARIFMANSFTDTNQVEKAVPLLREVMATNSNLAEAHWELGYAYRFAGILPESIAECQKARKLDPNVKLTNSAFNSYLYAGQYDAFISSLPQREDSAFILFYFGLGNYYQQRWSEAARYFDQAYEKDPNMLQTQVGKALSYAIASQPQPGLELIRKTARKVQERDVSDAEAVYKVAQAFAVLGDSPAALRLLRRTVEGGFFCYPYFTSDPLLENIRQEPEFQVIMATAQERHTAFKNRFLVAGSVLQKPTSTD